MAINDNRMMPHESKKMDSDSINEAPPHWPLLQYLPKYDSKMNTKATRTKELQNTTMIVWGKDLRARRIE